MNLRLATAALGVAVLSLSCTNDNGGVAGVLVVANVDVSPGISNLILGSTLQLAATPKTASGIDVPGRSVTWSSTAAGTASVSSSGLVTGNAVGGPVRIRATVDGVTGDALITVMPVPVDHVTVSPSPVNLLVSGTRQLTASAFDANNNTLTGRSFLWESSNSAIAAVTSTGLLLGIGQGGPVTISATTEGKIGTTTASVTDRPATRLGFIQQPGPGVAGQSLTPSIKVALQDDLLRTVLGAINPVTIELAGNPGGATLGGSTLVNGENGLATFANLTLNRAANGYTFLVTSPGLLSATSTPFSITAGSGNQLAFATLPSPSAVSGVPLQQQPVLQLKDAQGNNVAQAGVTITATLASGTGSLGGSTTATTNAAGTATFTDLAITGIAGIYTVAFNAAGVAALISPSIAIGAGSAGALVLVTQPSSTAQSGVPIPQQPVLQLRDAAGNPVPQSGVVVTAVLVGGSGTLGGATTAMTNGGGTAAFTSLAINGASGVYTLTFTSPGLTPAGSGPIVLGPGGPTKLTITTQPSATAASGAVLAQQPSAQLRDASNNPVALAGVQVTATVSVGGTLGGTVTVPTNASGLATFTNLSITALVGSYTLAFNGPSLTASPASNSIGITPGSASQLTYSQQPSISAQSGAAFAQQPSLQLRDAAGNPVSTTGVVVTATITGTPAGVSFVGSTTATTNGSGVATFANLGLSGTAGSYTLTFTAPGPLTSPASNSIALSAGGASQITYTQQPATSANSGQALATQPILLLRDASNNPISGAVITATVTSAPAGVTLVGTVTATTNGSGVATFVGSGLGLQGPVGNYALTFTSGTVSSSASNTIALAAGTPTQLTYSTQPSTTANSGQAFATQPVLLLRDASNNPVSGVAITATITGAPVGVTLLGTATATTNASGLATFTGLGLSGPVGTYTLTFTGASLTSAASNGITLSAGTATQLTYTQQPSTTANSGQAFAQQPILLLRDAANNPVAGAIVTATITGSPAGVTRIGTTTATTNGSGLATFVGSGLGLSGPAGSYTLTFTAGAVTSAASNTIVLSAGAGTQLTYNTQPLSSATSGAAFTQQPALLLRDASNNPISGAVVTATVTGSPAGVSFVGSTTATTNGSGIATFVGLGLSGPVGSYTLTFTSGAATSVASNSIALAAGTATQLTYGAQPSATATSGVAFATQPVLLLRDAANNPVSGQVVTASITGSPAGVSFVGTATATTNGSGLATFSGLGLSGPAGSYTLTFTAGAVTSAASNSIALSAGAGTQLTYNTQPSATANSGQVFGQQPVLLLRDASNNPISSAVVTATVTGSPAGVTFVGTTTATTNGSGFATFGGLGLSGPVGSYTLTFTSGAATSVASNAIALSAGTANKLTYSQQPSISAQSGVAFAQQPVLQVRDAANNPVLVAGTVVTATITGAPAGVSFVGTTTAMTNGSGVATFTTLGLSGTTGSYTLTFTAPGPLTSPASNSIALSAGGASQLTYNQQPSTSATSGQAFATQPILLLRDASNNPIGSTVVTATITGSPAGVSFVGTTTATTNGSGVATFSGLGLSGPVGSYTLTFTANAGAVTSSASNAIALAAGTATQLTYNTQPSSSATSGSAFGTQPVMLLRDAASNPVAGIVITATITGAPAGVSLIGTATATTNGSGLASFSGLGLTGTTGTYTLTFTGASLTSAPSNGITLSSGTPTQLTYSTQPSTTVASGAAFAQAPVLLLRDASNNPIGSTTVTATITGAPAGVSFVGTATATTNGFGLATFTGLGLNGPIGSYTLTFTAGSVTSAASNAISVTVGAATQLTYNTQPSPMATSGQPFATPPALLLRDSGNNPVGSTSVTATIVGSPAGVSFVGTATVSTNGSGVATFTGLGLSGPAGSYTLRFSAGALNSVASNAIALSAGAGTQLTYNTQPSGTVASGAAFAQPPVLLLRDGANNPVGSASVTATITGSPAGVSFVGTATATTNGSGLATFTGLGLNGPIGSYTLTFTSGAATSPASNSISVTTGAATQLTYNTQPSSSAASGAAFAQQPVLLLRDSGNNPIASTGVTATITGSPGGVSFVGTPSATTNGSGLATFSGLGLSGPPGTYSLTFTAGLVTSAASGGITLSAGTPTQLTYTTQPSSTVASGAAFAQAPALLLRDAANNPIASTSVTATITGSPAGVSFVGTPSATTNGSGVATFSGLGLSGPIGSYTLTFASGSVTSAASNSISVTVGAATQLSFSTQPSSSSTSGAAFAQQPALLLRDSGNNLVGSTSVTAAITGSPAGVSFVGTPSATTNGSGVATFSGLGLNGPAGNYTLTFTSGAATSSASGNIALSAGAPSSVTYNTQPPISATSGSAFSQQPALLVRDAGNNPVGSTLVTASITGSPAGVSLIGSPTATTVSGVATFSGLGLSGTPGSYTLTFTAGAASSAPSISIGLSPGAPSQVTYNTQPSATANSGAAFPQQPALLVRDGSNNPLGGVLVTASIASTPGGGSLIGATATTNGSGVATFSGLGISGTVGSYTLTFTAGAATSAASTTIALSAGTPSQLTYIAQPSSSSTSGAVLAQQPALLLRDAANNPIGSTAVTAAITGSPAGVSFVGTPSATTNGSGVATFSGLGLSGPAGTYSLTFTGAAVTSAASTGITLSAGAPSSVTYNTQPSTSATTGAAFAQQPALLVRDAGSVPLGGILVTASIAGSPAGVSLVGTGTATTNGSGVATFIGLGLSGPPGTYSLTFTAGSASSVASNGITLAAGSPSSVTYNTQPSTTATSGAAFAQQPALLVRDGSSNPLGSVVVTATITGAPAGVSLVGTTTATTIGSGVATFSNLGLSGPAGGYTLTFTAGSASSVASNGITLSAGAGTQLTYNAQPSTTVASGAVFAQQPALLLRDGGNNPVVSTLVTATITGGPAGVTFVGTPTATTDGSGVAIFAGLGLNGPIGSYTLTFTSGAATSAASNSISVTVGAATQLTYSAQPSTTVASGGVFAQQPVLLLRDSGNNPISGVLVTAAINGAGAAFVGTPSATTNGSGLATFIGLGLSGTVGTYSLTFTGSSISSVASNSISLTPGTATQLTITTQPSSTVTSGVDFPQQPTIQLRDASNNAVSQSMVSVAVAETCSGGLGANMSGTTSASTSGLGLATFTNLRLTLTPPGLLTSSCTLSFTSGGLTGIGSGSITVNP